MTKRRKILLTLIVALFVANLAYLYAKTRPLEPIAVIDFSGNHTVAIWDDPASIKNAIYLRSDGKWSLWSDRVVNPVDAADLTIPNTDSPHYWVWVNARLPMTFGHFLESIRSLAKRGVCNSVIMADTEVSGRKWRERSVLTLDQYSERTGRPLQKCRTSRAIDKRYDKAEAVYRLTKQRPAPMM